jgi:hypothetical protein
MVGAPQSGLSESNTRFLNLAGPSLLREAWGSKLCASISVSHQERLVVGDTPGGKETGAIRIRMSDILNRQLVALVAQYIDHWKVEASHSDRILRRVGYVLMARWVMDPNAAIIISATSVKDRNGKWIVEPIDEPLVEGERDGGIVSFFGVWQLRCRVSAKLGDTRVFTGRDNPMIRAELSVLVDIAFPDGNSNTYSFSPRQVFCVPHKGKQTWEWRAVKMGGRLP